MATMLESKGLDYTQQWFVNVTAQAGLNIYSGAPILERLTGQGGARIGTTIDRERVAEICGALTPELARAVVDALRAEGRRRHPHGQCRYCGLALNSAGECEECI